MWLLSIPLSFNWLYTPLSRKTKLHNQHCCIHPPCPATVSIFFFFFFLESFIFSNNNKSYKLHPCHTLALTSVMSVSFPQLRILHCVCLYFACIKFVIFCGVPKCHQFLKENPNSVVKRFFFYGHKSNCACCRHTLSLATSWYLKKTRLSSRNGCMTTAEPTPVNKKIATIVWRNGVTLSCDQPSRICQQKKIPVQWF